VRRRAAFQTWPAGTHARGSSQASTVRRRAACQTWPAERHTDKCIWQQQPGKHCEKRKKKPDTHCERKGSVSDLACSDTHAHMHAAAAKKALWEEEDEEVRQALWEEKQCVTLGLYTQTYARTQGNRQASTASRGPSTTSTGPKDVRQQNTDTCQMQAGRHAASQQSMVTHEQQRPSSVVQASPTMHVQCEYQYRQLPHALVMRRPTQSIGNQLCAETLNAETHLHQRPAWVVEAQHSAAGHASTRQRGAQQVSRVVGGGATQQPRSGVRFPARTAAAAEALSAL
jgi:hypothetical protein